MDPRFAKRMDQVVLYVNWTVLLGLMDGLGMDVPTLCSSVGVWFVVLGLLLGWWIWNGGGGWVEVAL